MKKFAIIYGECKNGIQKKAIELLSKILLDYTIEYPVCIKYSERHDVQRYTKIYIGTKDNNAYIKKSSETNLTHPEEYSVSVKDEIIIIEGYDDSGVLYGCADFYNKYIVSCEYTNSDETYWANPFEGKLPNFCLQSYPSVKNRGIWTWGHVIYDYRAFIDNMLILKMNTIIIWNDYVPFNAKEMVDYAHNAGIKVIWGYSWFWDTACAEIDIASVKDGINDIITKYENEYLPLGGDGIYFQSFTELDSEYIGHTLIAEAVTDFVNATSAALLKKYPNLELQFGLHANSVRERLEYIRKVDPRVRIVWENCGAFPFHYMPNQISYFEETMEFIKKITHLRGENDSFGVVTKGLTKLDWNNFAHIDGPVFTGISSKNLKENRVLRKKRIWKFIQSYWFTNADYARKAVQIMANEKQGELYITALVEDGMFEENIMFPVALFAEIMWNSDYNINKAIEEVTLRNYVEFA